MKTSETTQAVIGLSSIAAGIIGAVLLFKSASAIIFVHPKTPETHKKIKINGKIGIGLFVAAAIGSSIASSMASEK